MASPERPTGEVTFLFTDIEGSTRLVEALGTARWRPILERHREIVRAALAGNDGIEVKTEGDSFFAVFLDPRGAVAAAAEAQRGLAAEPWPDDAGIRVRMGLHTGLGELDADGEYVGHDVHRAARVASAANGGQVLLSETTSALVVGRLPGGVDLRPLGAHRLKDLRPEHITQLLLEGLSADFPPIRSLDARPNNLPIPLTSFVGRDRELAETRELLARSRLVTLTGPGGTGKSRLALQLAAAEADAFPGGVWWVPLATVRDPQLVLPAISRTIGAPERTDRAPDEAIVDVLAGKRALFVLDNLEQLLAAAPLFATLLGELPGLRMVATSRAPLRISGEQEYPVPGLPVPPDPGLLSPMERERLAPHLARRDPETLLAFEAVRLFVDRGAAVRPGFALGDANAADVAGIVSHLAGIPLAIELAAARLRFLTPAAIHERLEGRLDLPGGGALDVPERQRTLRGAIDWSYSLLAEAERRLFDRLGVFMGGFALEHAEAVSGGSAELTIDVLDGLATLVDHSLLRSDDAAGDPRFVLLEPIREFALEHLEASDDAEVIRGRHALTMLELVTRLEPLLSGDDQRRWLDRLELEHANIRAALDWAEARARRDVALPLAARTWRFWQKRGHLREARARLERLVAQPWAAEPDALRGDALEAAGGVAYWHGDFAGALPFYEEALAIRRATGSSLDVANALYNLSFCFTIGGSATPESRQIAIDALTEALDRYREAGDDRGTANALWGIGIHHYFRNENDLAIPPFREALGLYRRAGDRTQEAWAMRQLGSALLKSGDVEQARGLLVDALRVFDAAGDIAGVTLTLDRLASLAALDGDPARAARLEGLARRLQQSSGADLAQFVEEGFEAGTEVAARSALDPAASERYVAEGAAMSLDEGVRYAYELARADDGGAAHAGGAAGP